jgi:hypothetical protein
MLGHASYNFIPVSENITGWEEKEHVACSVIPKKKNPEGLLTFTISVAA